MKNFVIFFHLPVSRVLAAATVIVLSALPLAARENSSLLYAQGASMAKSGDIAGATEVFKHVIELSPMFSLGHYGLGKAYLSADGKTDDAIKEFKLAVLCDKKMSQAHFYLGMAYMFRRDYEWAISEFYASYLTDKTCIEALYNIGAIYDLMGHPYKSLKYYKEYFDAKHRDEDIFQ